MYSSHQAPIEKSRRHKAKANAPDTPARARRSTIIVESRGEAHHLITGARWHDRHGYILPSHFGAPAPTHGGDYRKEAGNRPRKRANAKGMATKRTRKARNMPRRGSDRSERRGQAATMLVTISARPSRWADVQWPIDCEKRPNTAVLTRVLKDGVSRALRKGSLGNSGREHDCGESRAEHD